MNVATASRFKSIRTVMGGALLLCTALPAWAADAGIQGTIADVISWIVLIAMPVTTLWIFWKVHVLPEHVAEQRQHPQKEAIRVLCLLSLFFGGLLWPLAWLWAYTKPVLYRFSYGRDKHDDYYQQPHTLSAGDRRDAVKLLREQVAQLEQQIQALDEPSALEVVRKEGRHA